MAAVQTIVKFTKKDLSDFIQAKARELAGQGVGSSKIEFATEAASKANLDDVMATVVFDNGKPLPK